MMKTCRSVASQFPSDLKFRNSSINSDIVSARWQFKCKMTQALSNLTFIKDYNQNKISQQPDKFSRKPIRKRRVLTQMTATCWQSDRSYLKTFVNLSGSGCSHTAIVCRQVGSHQVTSAITLQSKIVRRLLHNQPLGDKLVAHLIAIGQK